MVLLIVTSLNLAQDLYDSHPSLRYPALSRAGFAGPSSVMLVDLLAYIGVLDAYAEVHGSPVVKTENYLMNSFASLKLCHCTYTIIDNVHVSMHMTVIA